MSSSDREARPSLHQLAQKKLLADFFLRRSLTTSQAEVRASMFARTVDALISAGVNAQQVAEAFFTPGRIEVAGKHTDYAGGRSIVCAVDRGFAIVGVATADSTITIFDVARGEKVAFDLSRDFVPTAGHWSNYPMTVARRLVRNFDLSWKGANIALESNLPPAAGLSSSSALVVAVFSVLASVNQLENHPTYQASITSDESLGEYLGAVENGWSYRGLAGDRGVGTLAGSEDQTAILCSEPGTLKCFAYTPTHLERRVEMPCDWEFVIGSSGVQAQKTGDALHLYNNLATLAFDAATCWREQTGSNAPHLAAILAEKDFSLDRFQHAAARHSDPSRAKQLVRRMQQFYTEDQKVVPALLDALAGSDIAAFARATKLSYQMAEELLQNQIDETKALVRLAYECGAAAASAFGAGFGGSVWALATKREAEDFCRRWSQAYRSKFPQHAVSCDFFQSPPAPARMRLVLLDAK